MRVRKSERKSRTRSTGAPSFRYIARFRAIAAASRDRCSLLMTTAKRRKRTTRSSPHGPSMHGTRARTNETTTTTASIALIQSRR